MDLGIVSTLAKESSYRASAALEITKISYCPVLIPVACWREHPTDKVAVTPLPGDGAGNRQATVAPLESMRALHSARHAWLHPAPAPPGLRGASGHPSFRALRPGAPFALSRMWLASRILVRVSSVSRHRRPYWGADVKGPDSAGGRRQLLRGKTRPFRPLSLVFVPKPFRNQCEQTLLAGRGAGPRGVLC